MTPNTYTQAEKAAREALDNVAGFARYEALYHGDYASDGIDRELAETFPVCGGHKACLLGSAILGAGVKYNNDSEQWNDALAIMWGSNEDLGVDPEKARVLRLVRDALDTQAKATLKAEAAAGNKRAQALIDEFENASYRSSDSIAEAYFEEFLSAEHNAQDHRDSEITNTRKETRDAICNLAAAAKERIGLVPA